MAQRAICAKCQSPKGLAFCAKCHGPGIRHLCKMPEWHYAQNAGHMCKMPKPEGLGHLHRLCKMPRIWQNAIFCKMQNPAKCRIVHILQICKIVKLTNLIICKIVKYTNFINSWNYEMWKLEELEHDNNFMNMTKCEKHKFTDILRKQEMKTRNENMKCLKNMKYWNVKKQEKQKCKMISQPSSPNMCKM